MQKYLDAIRDNVCSICVDSNDRGDCTLTEKELCAVEYYLPNIIEVIHNSDADDIHEYYDELKEKICKHCRGEGDKDCYLREDSNCALDRYFPLIIETIKKVDGQEE